MSFYFYRRNPKLLVKALNFLNCQGFYLLKHKEKKLGHFERLKILNLTIRLGERN